MADLKISQFPSATSVSGTDIIPVVQGGFNRQVNITNLVTSISTFGEFELLGNKSTDTTLGGGLPSDTLYASQRAAKSYIDGKVFNLPATNGLQNVSGVIQPVYGSSINTITEGNDSRLSIKNVILVKKNPGAGEFSSWVAAIASITDASSTNPYMIFGGPGVFTESQIIGKLNVDLYGTSSDTTILIPSNPNQQFLIASDLSTVSDLTIQGANGPNGEGVAFTSMTGDGFYLSGCTVADCTIPIHIVAQAVPTLASIVGCSLAGTYSNGILIESQLGAPSEVLAHQVTAAITSPVTSVITVHGPGTVAFVRDFLVYGAPLNTAIGITAYDGATLVIQSVAFQSMDKAIWISNVGSPCFLNVAGVSTLGNTNDVVVDQTAAIGSIQGSFQTSNSSINSPTLSVFTADPSDGITFTGSLTFGSTYGSRVDATSLILRGPATGVYGGGTLTDGGGLILTISGGYGYAEDNADNLSKVSWNTQTVTLPANSINYIYFDYAGALIVSPSPPAQFRGLLLGRVGTTATGILFIDPSMINAEHMASRLDTFNREGLGAIYDQGSLVVEVGIRGLTVGSGSYFFSENHFMPSGAIGATWTAFYGDGSGGLTRVTQTAVDNAFYDNGTGTLVAIPVGQFAKPSLYIVGDGANEKYFLVYPTVTYATQLAAEGADIPTPPPFFRDGIVLIASIIVSPGSANIVEIRDERPVIGFKASGISAPAYHSSLLGLLNDDHPQYLLTNGGRALTGDQSFGGHNITSLGTANGVTIEAHAARHLPLGADALATAAPSVNLSSSSTNSVGIANSISRSDHGHAITNSNLTELTSSVLTITGGVGAVLGSGTSIQVKQAGALQSGYLSLTDWNTFNGKQAALSLGTVTETTSSILTLSGWTNATVGSPTITVSQASGSQPGYLSNTDWSTFNTGATTAAAALPSASFTDTAVTGKLITGFVSGAGTVTATDTILQAINKINGNVAGKQASGNYITSLTSDVTASGPGASAATIASGAVSLTKMASLAANSIIGNNTGVSATPLALTATQVTAMLNLFSSTLKGLVPLSGGGTTTFLRADGSWSTPPTVALPISIGNGGTGATTLAGARTALGITAGSSFITSGTTYTTPAGITASTQFKFTLVGGGGGGAGVAAGTGNKSTGGGAAGAGVLFTTGLTASTGYTIAIGAAGTAGTNTPGAGGNGGNTTITIGATTYTAAGGTGGPTGINSAGGAGGTTTNLTMGITGQAGGGVGAASSSVVSGVGGSSGLGLGMGGPGVQGATAGLAATGFGGGGSGASSNGSTAAGGAGTAGMILVEYWN